MPDLSSSSSFKGRRQTLAVLRTPGYNCFAVKFSPFPGGQLAVATSRNFGMKGSGRLYICDYSRQSMRHIDHSDGLFDVAWSEARPDQLIGASANGTLILWTGSNVTTWPKEHAAEVSSVDWNHLAKEQVLSASWDSTIRRWDVGRGESIGKWWAGEAPSQVYQVAWSPHAPSLFGAVGADRSLCIYDTRHHQHHPVIRMEGAHSREILCMDWNKYHTTGSSIATGSVDLSIHIWDIRMNGHGPIRSGGGDENTPTTRLSGHRRAVRRVRWSPYSANQLVSVGYDMTIRWWNLHSLNPLEAIDEESHTEFVTGLDFSLETRNLLATCSWDETVRVMMTE